MNEECGCCEGIEKLTPGERFNRPGLSTLSYRVGTHASFLETMKARLSNLAIEFELDERDASHRRLTGKRLPLAGLTTREPSDPSVAFLDAWANVADILTFYQERIANEGYLRTATERRSILELARLLGYSLRPGVAATTYLAYTLEKGSKTIIPVGTRSQSVPGPGEQPQSFETSDPIEARSEWNNLRPRMSRPQRILSQQEAGRRPRKLYLQGTQTKLKPNDPLLIVIRNQPPDGRVKSADLYRVMTVAADTKADRTTLEIIGWNESGVGVLPPAPSRSGVSALSAIVEHHLDVESAGVSPSKATVRQVVKQLESLQTRLNAGVSEAEAYQTINEETLPQLRKILARPTTQSSVQLSSWIRRVVANLEGGAELMLAAKAVGSPDIFDENVPRMGGGGFTGASAPASSSSPYVPRGTIDPTRSSVSFLNQIKEQLIKPAAAPPPSSRQLDRNAQQSYASKTDLTPRLVAQLFPPLQELLYQALSNAPVSQPTETYEVHALRAAISLFGAKAQPKPLTFNPSSGTIATTGDWPIIEGPPDGSPPRPGRIVHEEINAVHLEGSHEKITPDSWMVVETPATMRLTRASTLIVKAQSPNAHLSRSKYGVTGESTRVVLGSPNENNLTVRWITGNVRQLPQSSNADDDFDAVRRTVVYAESELLTLAEEPIDNPVCGNRIELDGVYEGLESGRWIIVTGERTDLVLKPPPARQRVQLLREIEYKELLEKERIEFVRGNEIAPGQEFAFSDESVSGARVAFGDESIFGAGGPGRESSARVAAGGRGTEVLATPQPREKIPGIVTSQLLMLAGVEQSYDSSLPNDKLHTTLVLQGKGLDQNCYKRATITIYGNVVKATHGETRTEVLGGGDASVSMQTFELRQSPLTYVAATTTAGVESTLEVRVNDLLWHEADSLAWLGPTARSYITMTDDEDKTRVIFGNGERGARPPTGSENIKAVYRTGIGKPGNVGAGKITSVATKPLGVKEVINPLDATGGGDREDRDSARSNAPLAVMSLDRLVSVQDYEDFTRTFAGIGKARAVRLSDGRRRLVFLTIAGADDIPIAETSDLYQSLRQALRKFGDPFQAFQIKLRSLMLLLMTARVRLLPDYLWEAVEPKIRAALLERFSFRRRALGQDALLSEAVSAVQAVEGVLYVDFDKFDAVGEETQPSRLEHLADRLKLKPRILVRDATINEEDDNPATRIRPAQLAVLSPAVPDTLILTEIEA